MTVKEGEAAKGGRAERIALGATAIKSPNKKQDIFFKKNLDKAKCSSYLCREKDNEVDPSPSLPSNGRA